MAHIPKNLTLNPNIDMVINPADNLFDIGNGYENDRDCSLLLSIYRPQLPSISSSECSEEHHIHVKRTSDKIDENKPVGSINSIRLEYAFQRGQKDQVSKTTDITSDTLQQCISNKDWALNLIPGNNVFNINLNYDIDQALDLEE